MFYNVCGIPFSDELYHHGIFGQKWGIRRYQNPDGTLTAEGRARYGSGKEQKKLAELLTKNAGNTINSRSINMAKVKSTPQVKAAANAVSAKAREAAAAEEQYWDLVGRFYKDSDLYEKYLNASVDRFMQDYPGTMDRQRAYEWFKYDDGDQGDYSSIELFERSGDPRAKELVEARKALNDTERKSEEASKQYAKQFLGDYGNMSLTNLSGTFKTTAEARLASIINNEAKLKNMSISSRLAYGNKVY